jgi:tetratricopeptide (TPR) repeat protein
VLGLTIGLVAGPLFWRAWPDEMARWKGAAAEELQLAGQISAAREQVEQALAASPESLSLRQLRMQLLAEEGTFGRAIDDCGWLLERQPGNVGLLLFRSGCYQQLRQHPQAQADIQAIFTTLEKQAVALADPGPLESWLLEGVDDRREQLLAEAHNTRAYGVAVAQWHGAIESETPLDAQALEAARNDAEQAVRWMEQTRRPELSAMLDTRGFLHYLLGNDAAALDDLTRALSDEQNSFERKVNEIRQSTPDPRVAARALRSLKRNTAVIRFHRILVLRRLERTDEAQAELKKIVQLGIEPNANLF